MLRASVFIRLFCFDLGKSNVPVKHRVMGKIDLLLAALAEKLPDLITASGKGSWFRRNLR